MIAFAAAHPDLSWQPSDPDPAARISIAAWIAAADLTNVRAPLDVDVTTETWPRALERPPQAIVCMNLLHVAPWAAGAGLLAGAGQLLERGAPLYLDGPFSHGGRHTAPGNEQFDRSIRRARPRGGGRVRGAPRQDLLGQEPMPANNFSVILCRR